MMRTNSKFRNPKIKIILRKGIKKNKLKITIIQMMNRIIMHTTNKKKKKMVQIIKCLNNNKKMN
jgi:hypothetical protein